jgi:hypothetical protein
MPTNAPFFFFFFFFFVFVFFLAFFLILKVRISERELTQRYRRIEKKNVYVEAKFIRGVTAQLPRLHRIGGPIF